MRTADDRKNLQPGVQKMPRAGRICTAAHPSYICYSNTIILKPSMLFLICDVDDLFLALNKVPGDNLSSEVPEGNLKCLISRRHGKVIASFKWP